VLIDRCPHNRFGLHCEYSCSQCIHGTCNWRMRTCDCQSGFSGTFCNQSTAIVRNSIDDTIRCQLCHKGNTASCHMEVGIYFIFNDMYLCCFTSFFRPASVNVCLDIMVLIVTKVSYSTIHRKRETSIWIDNENRTCNHLWVFIWSIFYVCVCVDRLEWYLNSYLVF